MSATILATSNWWEEEEADGLGPMCNYFALAMG